MIRVVRVGGVYYYVSFIAKHMSFICWESHYFENRRENLIPQENQDQQGLANLYHQVQTTDPIVGLTPRLDPKL